MLENIAYTVLLMSNQQEIIMKASHVLVLSFSVLTSLTGCETAPLTPPQSATWLTPASAAVQDSSKVTAPGLFDLTLQQTGGPHMRDTVRVKVRNLQSQAVDYQIQLRVIYPEPIDGLSAQVLGALSTGPLLRHENSKLEFDSRGLSLTGASKYRAEVFTKGIYFGDFAVEK